MDAVTAPATFNVEPSNVRLDSTVASSASLYVATPLISEELQSKLPPPQ